MPPIQRKIFVAVKKGRYHNSWDFWFWFGLGDRLIFFLNLIVFYRITKNHQKVQKYWEGIPWKNRKFLLAWNFQTFYILIYLNSLGSLIKHGRQTDWTKLFQQKSFHINVCKPEFMLHLLVPIASSNNDTFLPWKKMKLIKTHPPRSVGSRFCHVIEGKESKRCRLHGNLKVLQYKLFHTNFKHGIQLIH